MNSILICRNCGAQIRSPVSGPPGSIQGSPGLITTKCPQCGSTVDILYD